MICVQKSTCLSPKPDTMAGYNPQSRPRSKAAAARYIIFFCLFVFFIAAEENYDIMLSDINVFFSSFEAKNSGLHRT
jgi:hypothetical protein